MSNSSGLLLLLRRVVHDRGAIIASAVLGGLLLAVWPGVSRAQTDKVYWASPDIGKVQRANLNGTDREDVAMVPAGLAPQAVAVDPVGSKLYRAGVIGVTPTIQRGNLDRTQVETLFAGPLLFTVWGLAVDPVGGKMYRTNVPSSGLGSIQRANLDGTNVETVLSGLSVPWGGAVDGTQGSCTGPRSRTSASSVPISMGRTWSR
jgi:DNA-binding beta-propeller fold protein YncE